MSEQLDKLSSLIQKLRWWEETINEALSHGRKTHSFDDIVTMILQNRVFLFVYDEAFVIMEKVEYPQFSVFHCFLAGGKLEAVLAAQSEMEELGEKMGCKYLSMAGRKGWGPSLTALGWHHVCTTMYKPIGEKTHERRERRKSVYNGVPAPRN